MLTHVSREYIATTLVAWLRDPQATQSLLEWTPRNIRDQVRNMIPLDDVEAIERDRVANQVARWIQDEDGYIRIRWDRDAVAVRAVLRVIDAAIETEGAEGDDDIVNDETAWSYPRLFDWLRMVHADMRGFVKEQKRVGARPKKAFDLLVHHAHGSILDAQMEC